MNCFLCGNGDGHYLNCAVAANPGLTEAQAREAGLLARAEDAKEAPASVVEILPENSMVTVPLSNSCEFGECDNPKYSDHPRVKYCEDHKDPKNRKE